MKQIDLILPTLIKASVPVDKVFLFSNQIYEGHAIVLYDEDDNYEEIQAIQRILRPFCTHILKQWEEKKHYSLNIWLKD